MKVITYGTFELFHEGHVRLLQEAKALVDDLTVGVTTDNYDDAQGKLNVQQSLMKRTRNVQDTEHKVNTTELASYPRLAILKLLGLDRPPRSAHLLAPGRGRPRRPLLAHRRLFPPAATLARVGLGVKARTASDAP